MEEVLVATSLTRRFGGFTALRGVNITLRRGEIRGLIGSNGAGKSTLMDVLCGRTDEMCGQILLEGLDISRYKIAARRKSGLSRSFQATNIFPLLTVGEQFSVAGRLAGDDNSAEVMAELDLTMYEGMLVSDLSYGVQRRVDVGLALIGRPRLLLLDEPAAGLTADESMDLAYLIKSLSNKWGVTTLLVEHDMKVVFGISDYVTVLHLGQIIAEGRPQEVQKNPTVISAYLGSLE